MYLYECQILIPIKSIELYYYNSILVLTAFKILNIIQNYLQVLSLLTCFSELGYSLNIVLRLQTLSCRTLLCTLVCSIHSRYIDIHLHSKIGLRIYNIYAQEVLVFAPQNTKKPTFFYSSYYPFIQQSYTYAQCLSRKFRFR